MSTGHMTLLFLTVPSTAGAVSTRAMPSSSPEPNMDLRVPLADSRCALLCRYATSGLRCPSSSISSWMPPATGTAPALHANAHALRTAQSTRPWRCFVTNESHMLHSRCWASPAAPRCTLRNTSSSLSLRGVCSHLPLCRCPFAATARPWSVAELQCNATSDAALFSSYCDAYAPLCENALHLALFSCSPSPSGASGLLHDVSSVCSAIQCLHGAQQVLDRAPPAFDGLYTKEVISGTNVGYPSLLWEAGITSRRAALCLLEVLGPLQIFSQLLLLSVLITIQAAGWMYNVLQLLRRFDTLLARRLLGRFVTLVLVC